VLTVLTSLTAPLASITTLNSYSVTINGFLSCLTASLGTLACAFYTSTTGYLFEYCNARATVVTGSQSFAIDNYYQGTGSAQVAFTVDMNPSTLVPFRFAAIIDGVHTFILSMTQFGIECGTGVFTGVLSAPSGLITDIVCTTFVADTIAASVGNISSIAGGSCIYSIVSATTSVSSVLATFTTLVSTNLTSATINVTSSLTGLVASFTSITASSLSASSYVNAPAMTTTTLTANGTSTISSLSVPSSGGTGYVSLTASNLYVRTGHPIKYETKTMYNESSPGYVLGEFIFSNDFPTSTLSISSTKQALGDSYVFSTGVPTLYLAGFVTLFAKVNVTIPSGASGNYTTVEFTWGDIFGDVQFGTDPFIQTFYNIPAVSHQQGVLITTPADLSQNGVDYTGYVRLWVKYTVRSAFAGTLTINPSDSQQCMYRNG